MTEHGFAAQSKGSSNAQSDVITRAPSVSVAGVLVGSSKSSCAAAAIFVASSEAKSACIATSSLSANLVLASTLSGNALSTSELTRIARVAPRIKDSVSQGTASTKKRIIAASDPNVPGAASDTITDIHSSDGIWGQQ